MSVPVLSCHNLYKSYKGGKFVLENFQCSLASGKIIGLLGPNGCGKSTLMKLINSRLTPTRGSITLGYNVKIGYYDQENRGLTETKTVFDELHDETYRLIILFYLQKNWYIRVICLFKSVSFAQ